MSVTNVKEFQKEEVLAIKSIYQNEYELLEGCFKKKYKPPKLSIYISVKPEKVTEESLEKSLKLIINCSDKYPLEPPELSLLILKNVNTKEESDLLKRLKEKAKNDINTQMMHGLIEECREYLRAVVDSKVKAKEAPVPKPATNIDMMHERQELVKKSEIEKIKVEVCHHAYNEDSKPVLFISNGKSAQIRVMMGRCNGVHISSLISSKSRIVTNEYAGYNLSEGEPIKIRQIAIYRQFEPLTSSHYFDTDFLKNLSDDLIGLSKLSHPNIITYMGSKVTQTHNKKKKSVQICAQYLVSDNGYKPLKEACENFPQPSELNSPRIPELMIRKIIREMMDAVKYLHDRNITFIKISISSLLVDPQLRVYLSEYYIGKRFLELSEYGDDVTTDTAVSNDSSNNLKKGTKKYDIYNVGVLAEDLFYFGVSEEDKLENCATMPGKLTSFIECCRESPADVFSHEYIAEPCYNNSQTADRGAGYNDANKNVGNISTSMAVAVPEDQLREWRFFDDHSRIPTEFEVIECLGSGSFGTVVKVKNKYDNQFYAIKKVRMSKLKKKAEKRTMREVQLLSSLNHENIVRYYATWSEDVPVTSANLSEETTANTTTNENSFIIKRPISSSLGNNMSNGESVRKSSITNTGLVDLSESQNNNNDCFMHESDYSDDDDSEDSDSDSDSESDNDEDDDGVGSLCDSNSDSLITFGESTRDESRVSRGTGKSVIASTTGHTSRHSKQDKSGRSQKFLMIQMELCEGSSNTLQKWIATRDLYKNEKLVWRFVREITAGLDHLHSKNMIHRDLKPGNIFLDAADRVKLGDLGLAVDFVKHTMPSSAGPVGTSFYICPEIMSSRPYSAKADMYSMGIIVFEMTYPPFKTGSERFRTLEDLRSLDVKFPGNYRTRDSRFKTLITALLSHDAAKRPSSSDLMQYELIPPPEAREMELRKHLVRVTNDPSSALYKILLKKMFTKVIGSIGSYEMLISGQSAFRQFILNSNHVEETMDSAKCGKQKTKGKFHDLVQGDFQYFEIQELLEDTIVEIFRSHGAAPLLTPILHPNIGFDQAVPPPTQSSESACVSLLDSEGVVVHLPTNLRENWVLFVVNNGITNCRRYALGPVFKHQDYRGYHPRQTGEAAFDIITDKDDVKSKVECICILESIFRQLLFRESQFQLQLNDSRLFRALMAYFKIPINQHARISGFFQQLVLQKSCNKVNLESMETELRKDLGMSDSNYQFMRQILSFSGDIEEFRKYLRTFASRVTDLECCKTIMSGFTQLEQLIRHVEVRFHENRHFSLYLTPSLTSQSESSLNLYSGLVFQLVVKFPVPEVRSNVTGADNGSVNKGNKQLSDKTYRAVAKFLNTPKILCVGGCYGGNWLGCPKCVDNIPTIQGGAGSGGGGQRGSMRCRHVHGIGFSIDVTGFTQTLHNLSLISSSLFHLPDRHGLVQVLIENTHPQDDLLAWKMANHFWEHGISAIIDSDDSISHTKKQSIPIYIEIAPSTSCATSINTNNSQISQSDLYADIESGTAADTNVLSLQPPCSSSSRIFMMQYYPSVIKLADDCSSKWEAIVNKCIARLHHQYSQHHNHHHHRSSMANSNSSRRRQSTNSIRSKGTGINHQNSSNPGLVELANDSDILPSDDVSSTNTSTLHQQQQQSMCEDAVSFSNTYTFILSSSNSTKQFVYARLPETAKQLHQMRVRISDKLVSNAEAGLILRASCRLQKEASWFSSPPYISPSRLLAGCSSVFVLILELDPAVCRTVAEQAVGLAGCVTKVTATKLTEDSCSRISGTFDKQFRQLLTSIWTCIISYTKDKIYKLAVYSISGDQIFLVDLK